MVLNPAIPTPQLLVAAPAAARNRPHCTTGCHRLGCCDQVRHRDLVPRDWRFACSWSSSAGVLGVRATWNGGLSRPEQPKTSSTLLVTQRRGETALPGRPPPAPTPGSSLGSAASGKTCRNRNRSSAAEQLSQQIFKAKRAPPAPPTRYKQRALPPSAAFATGTCKDSYII